MQKLQETINLVKTRGHVLETMINDLKKEALTQKKADNQSGVVLTLKQIKQYQEELVKLNVQFLMLQQQRGMIESSHLDKQVFAALSYGKKALDAIQKEHDIDDFLDLQDEIAE